MRDDTGGPEETGTRDRKAPDEDRPDQERGGPEPPDRDEPPETARHPSPGVKHEPEPDADNLVPAEDEPGTF